MTIIARNSLAANLADVFATRTEILGGSPEVASIAIDAALLDVLAWEDDAFEPSPEDWAEYAAWSRSLDSGCGDRELTPDEADLLTATVDDRTYRDLLQDELADRYASERS